VRFFFSIPVAALVLCALGGSEVMAATSTPAGETPTATSTPSEDPALTKLARAQLDALRAGKIDRSLYTADVNAHFTDSDVTQVSQLLRSGGDVKSFTYSGNRILDGVPVSQYALTLERPISVPLMPTTDQWICSIATDSAGKISWLSLDPKQ